MTYSFKKGLKKFEQDLIQSFIMIIIGNIVLKECIKKDPELSLQNKKILGYSLAISFLLILSYLIIKNA